MTTALDQMTENELLQRANKALARVAVLPRGSLGRSVQWGVYETYARELNRRAIQFLTSEEFVMIQKTTDKLADVIRAWAAGKPKYTAVPTNAELAADLDFATTDTAWTIARNRLVGQGVIGRDGSHFYVR